MREACRFSSLVSLSLSLCLCSVFLSPPLRLSVFVVGSDKTRRKQSDAPLISPRSSLGGSGWDGGCDRKRRSEIKSPPPTPHLPAAPPSLSMAAWPPLIMHSLSIDGGTYSVAQCQATVQLLRCNCCVETLSCSISSLAPPLPLSLSLARLTPPSPTPPPPHLHSLASRRTVIGGDSG